MSKTALPNPLGPKRYALYRRVSKEAQVQRDLSLPEQKAQQHDYVLRAGGIVFAEYEDGGISGRGADDRPQFQEMIAAAKRREFDVILVHKSDRAFRNRDEASTYRILTAKLGVGWASVTESFFGSPDLNDKLLSGIMEAVNEFYSDNLGKEIKKGIRSAAVSKGHQHGQPPYGYKFADLTKKGAGWEIDEPHAERVRYVFRYIASTSCTVAELCRHINELGWEGPAARANRQERGLPYFPQMYSGKWNPRTVGNLLKSRCYTGEINHHDLWMPGHQPPLVETALAEHVRQLLRRRGNTSSHSAPALFGGGLLRCPVCAAVGIDTPLTVSTRAYRTKAEPDVQKHWDAAYHCGARQVFRKNVMMFGEDGYENVHECAGYTIQNKAVLRLLLAGLEQIISADALASRLAPVPSPRPAAPAPPRVSPLRKELGVLEQKRSGYVELFVTRAIDRPRYDAYIADLDARETALREAAEKDERETATLPAIDSTLAGCLKDILSSDNLPVQRRRDELKAYIDCILPSVDKMQILIVLHPKPVE